MRFRDLSSKSLIGYKSAERRWVVDVNYVVDVERLNLLPNNVQFKCSASITRMSIGQVENRFAQATSSARAQIRNRNVDVEGIFQKHNFSPRYLDIIKNT